jgi:hypothetical protein
MSCVHRVWCIRPFPCSRPLQQVECFISASVWVQLYHDLIHTCNKPCCVQSSFLQRLSRGWAIGWSNVKEHRLIEENPGTLAAGLIPTHYLPLNSTISWPAARTRICLKLHKPETRGGVFGSCCRQMRSIDMELLRIQRTSMRSPMQRHRARSNGRQAGTKPSELSLILDAVGPIWAYGDVRISLGCTPQVCTACKVANSQSKDSTSLALA